MLVSPTVNPTVIEYDGSIEVKAVFVNSGDYSFLENYIDPYSLTYFMKNIDQIVDKSVRSMIWFNISQMVKQTLIRLDKYIAFVYSKLFIESQTIVVSQLLTDLFNYLTNYLNE